MQIVSGDILHREHCWSSTVPAARHTPVYHQHTNCSGDPRMRLREPVAGCQPTKPAWVAFLRCPSTQQPHWFTHFLFPFFSDRHLQSRGFLLAQWRTPSCPGCSGKGVCFSAGSRGLWKSHLIYRDCWKGPGWICWAKQQVTAQLTGWISWHLTG